MYTKQDRETGLPLTGRDMYTKQDRGTVSPLTEQDVSHNRTEKLAYH